MDDRTRIMKQQVEYPEVFDQNQLLKFNYETDTELPISSEPSEQINGQAAKFDKSVDNEQVKRGPV